MKQYQGILAEIVNNGSWSGNRTGIDTIKINCATMSFDLRESFPIVTLKSVPFKTIVNEMLCFLRGYDNAKQFRAMGVKVWDQNANENKQWLTNPNRLGEDDLGRVYGVQARSWNKVVGVDKHGLPIFGSIDQLEQVYSDLVQGLDNRREIVTHWNPGEIDRMALPPCHLLYQFGLTAIQDQELIRHLGAENFLNMTMYQRSADMPLGVPFNITGYAWLLAVMAHITGAIPAKFLHVMHDAHIYENQIEAVKTMLSREPKDGAVRLHINPEIETIHDLESWVTADDFELTGYDPHPSIKIDMAV